MGGSNCSWEVARRANLLNEKMGSEQRQNVEEWVKEPPRIEVMLKAQGLDGLGSGQVGGQPFEKVGVAT